MEKWKQIDGFDRYLVSNMGRIKAISRYRKDPIRGNKFYREKILNPGKIGKGYLMIGLSNETGTKSFLIHRLVANAFLINENGVGCVNHKDGNKENNSASNLEWVTINKIQPTR